MSHTPVVSLAQKMATKWRKGNILAIQKGFLDWIERLFGIDQYPELHSMTVLQNFESELVLGIRKRRNVAEVTLTAISFGISNAMNVSFVFFLFR